MIKKILVISGVLISAALIVAYLNLPKLFRNFPCAFLDNIPGDLQPNIIFHSDVKDFPRTRDMKPGTSHKFSYHVNSLGFRGPQVRLGKGVRKVMILGDGYAFGTCLNDKETIGEKLDVKLKTSSGKGKIVVLNAALPGNTLSDHLSYMREKGYKLKPEIVILFVSPGNVWSMLRPGVYRERLSEFSHSSWQAVKWIFTNRDYVVNSETIGSNKHIMRFGLSKDQLKELAMTKYKNSFLDFQELVDGWGGNIIAVIVNSQSLEIKMEGVFQDEGVPYFVADRLLEPEIVWNAPTEEWGQDRLLWKTEDHSFGPKATERIAGALFKLIKQEDERGDRQAKKLFN